MPLETIQQVNFTRGELDPDLDRRSDLKDYFRGLARGTNFVFTPQGPARGRGGFAFVSQVRSPMSGVSTAAATFTAPNGGDADMAREGDHDFLVTTTPLDAQPVLVLLEIEWPDDVVIDAVDLIDMSAVAPAAPPGIPAPPGGWTGYVDGNLF